MDLRRRLFAFSLFVGILLACANIAKVGRESISSALHSPTMPSESLPSQSPTSLADSLSPCPVTSPNGNTPPGERPNSLQYGNGTLWTDLWPDGKVVFTPEGPGQINPDGSLAMKWPWWRGIWGNLAIEGRRLDAPAPPLRAAIPDGYGPIGFQASGLIFPSEGCWEVTGKVGDASLTFVTLVVKVQEHK